MKCGVREDHSLQMDGMKNQDEGLYRMLSTTHLVK
jgi:hypothetical protein